MPTMQNIVLDDAATPAVPRTFKPMSLRNDVGTYQDDSSGRVSEWPTISIGTRPASKTNAGHKTTLKIVLPHPVDDSDGACCVDKNNVASSLVTVEFLRSSVATNDQINDLLKFLQQMVENGQFTATAKGESLR